MLNSAVDTLEKIANALACPPLEGLAERRDCLNKN